MNLTLIASLVSALFAGAVGYGTAKHFGDVKITELELTHANERIAIQRAARANTERLTQQVTAAQDEAQRRAADLRRDAVTAANAAGGLRIASTNAVRVAADSCEACGAIVSAYDQLFAEGSELLREVASTADQCISDNKALSDGWPTSQPQSH